MYITHYVRNGVRYAVPPFFPAVRNGFRPSSQMVYVFCALRMLLCFDSEMEGLAFRWTFQPVNSHTQLFT